MTTVENIIKAAEAYGEASYADDCGHFPEGASRPLRAALRTAIEAAIADAVAVEREAIANSVGDWIGCDEIAAGIRARGEVSND